MTNIVFKTDGNFAIHVPDLDKALAFYHDVLGFELLEQSETSLVFNTGTITLYIVLDTQEVISYIPALKVQSFEKATAYLKSHDVKLRRDNGRTAYFQDPFGIVFDVIEE